MINDPTYEGLPQQLDGALKIYTLNKQIDSNEIWMGWIQLSARLLEKSLNEIVSLRTKVNAVSSPKGDCNEKDSSVLV